jgi:lysophospholipase L1-like esterase
MLAFCGGYAAHRWRQHPDSNHFTIREMAIASQAAQLKNVDWLLLGDTLVELASIPSICGGSVLNSGIGGAGVTIVADTLAKLADIKARNIVIEVGINDAARKIGMSPIDFSVRYRRLVAEAQATGAKVFVSITGPVAKGMALGDIYFDPDLIRHIDIEIKKIATSEHLGIVDFSTMADADGYLPADETIDGVHLRPNGYVVWRSILEKSVCG